MVGRRGASNENELLRSDGVRAMQLAFVHEAVVISRSFRAPKTKNQDAPPFVPPG